jgi:hypothetical protein
VSDILDAATVETMAARDPEISGWLRGQQRTVGNLAALLWTTPGPLSNGRNWLVVPTDQEIRLRLANVGAVIVGHSRFNREPLWSLPEVTR